MYAILGFTNFDVWLIGSRYTLNKDMKSFYLTWDYSKMPYIGNYIENSKFRKNCFQRMNDARKPYAQCCWKYLCKKRDWLVEHKKHYFEQEIYIVYLFSRFPKDFLQHVLHISEEDLKSFEKVLAS